jgi:MFS family permease
LLAGTALMFSTRFLLMAVGSALGGWAAAVFGYEIAFIINAASFGLSAFTVWLIPEEATRDQVSVAEVAKPDINPTPSADAGAVPIAPQSEATRASFMTDLREGLTYTVKNRFALTILIMNMIWALGGGSINIIFERFGGVYFAGTEGWNPDVAVALLWTATGIGLTLGMLIAHRTSIFLDRKRLNRSFIGWTLVIHGVLFALGGLVPTLWMLAVIVLMSRVIVGVEYAVQETMFQRSLPDYIRGRISTLDRGAELGVFGLASYAASEAMFYITPQTLTIISGLISALAGVVWFIREKDERTFT